MATSTRDPAEQEFGAAVAASAGGVERRRPGRPENVDPALIPLLRREQLLRPKPAAGLAVPGGSADDLASARGVAASAAIGALLWGSIIAGAWWLFGL